jgi:hypothetical protein
MKIPDVGRFDRTRAVSRVSPNQSARGYET